MKYIVLTTKHHVGFCLWDSELTDWNVVDQTPFKRDIVKELAAACKAEGLELGFYYSIADYHHSLYEPKYQNRPNRRTGTKERADIKKYIDFMFGQLEELCELYHPCLIWFDGGSGFRNPAHKPLLRRQELVDMLHSHGTLSNSRLGDDDPLLIVGPDHEGVIPKDQETRLMAMGDWLTKNGEAIYGTQAGPYPYEISWGTITQRKEQDRTSLYLHVLEWPQDGKFTLFGVNNPVQEASLLASGESPFPRRLRKSCICIPCWERFSSVRRGRIRLLWTSLRISRVQNPISEASCWCPLSMMRHEPQV